jgi:uncharacterized membrane protein
MERFVLGNGPWMTWNTTLAIVPLLMAVALFGRDATRRSPVWWLGFAGLVVALPNAPYVLTDVVHLPGSLHEVRPSLAMEGGVALAYALLFTIGVASYVLTLHLLGEYARRAGWARRTSITIEVTLHAACAVGIYLGRFPGLNSWDLLRRPADVADGVRGVATPFGIAAVTTLYVVVAVAATATRWLALGAAEQLRRRHR